MQKKNGYTPIANQLLEAIYRTDFNATELKIILLIARFTFGYSKKEGQFSLSFITNGIGISKRYVSGTVSKLIKDNVLIVVKEHTDTESRTVQINKDYDTWMNRTINQQLLNCSTVDVESNTTDDVEFNPTDEVQFHQIKQSIKQSIKQDICNFQRIIDMYHEICVSYPRATKLSEARKKAIKARLKTYTEDDFRDLFQLAEDSDFLKGKNNRNWSANLDWLIKDSNMAKVLDGNYSKKGSTVNGEQFSNNGYGHVKTGNELMDEIRHNAGASGAIWEAETANDIFK